MALAIGRALGSVVVVLALTGCVSTVSPPEAGFSQAQLDLYGAAAANSALPEELRPAPDEVRYVDFDDWGTEMVACFAEQGFTGYEPFPGGYSGSGEDTPERQLATLVCSARIQADPSSMGVLNDAELAYLYDYYRESTIPCLELAGLTVLTAPSKADFIASGGAWEPYAAMGGEVLSPAEVNRSPWYRSTPDQDLTERCATWPPEWEKQGRTQN